MILHNHIHSFYNKVYSFPNNKNDSVLLLLALVLPFVSIARTKRRMLYRGIHKHWVGYNFLNLKIALLWVVVIYAAVAVEELYKMVFIVDIQDTSTRILVVSSTSVIPLSAHTIMELVRIPFAYLGRSFGVDGASCYVTLRNRSLVSVSLQT